MTLRTKTMLILVITVVVSLGGSGYFFLEHFEKNFKQSVFQTVDAVAHNNAHFVEAYLSSQRGMIVQSGVVFSENFHRQSGSVPPEQFLEGLVMNLPSFDGGFFFIDRRGILQASYPVLQEHKETDFSQADFFSEVMTTHSWVAGKPTVLGVNSRPGLLFATYLETPDGEPLGILGGIGLLTADGFLAANLRKRIGRSGYSYIIDHSRRLLIHPNQERLFKRDVLAGDNQMLDAALDGFQGVTETVNSRGVEMFVAFYPIAGTDWIVASQEPVAEALAPLQTGKTSLLLFAGFGSLLAAGIGLLMVHKSMQGLVLLEKTTAELMIPTDAGNELEAGYRNNVHKLDALTRHAEFGTLAGVISGLYSRGAKMLIKKNKIAEELEAAYQQLKSTQAQIVQQEKMASVGQLAAGVAHEINNPIGFIGSNLRALSKHLEKITAYRKFLKEWDSQSEGETSGRDLDEVAKKLKIDFVLADIEDLIEESREGVERIRKIVRNLSSFSRMDKLELQKFDVNECIESTLAIAWNEIKYKATVEKDLADLPLIDCYPQQLNQVFLNLLINAIHAMESKGHIKISSRLDHDLIKVSIQDNGSGIAEPNLARIFEPFFTTKEIGKGTGLGLSISYDIIKKHHGDIKVESILNEGTTFIIELPLAVNGDDLCRNR